MQVLKQRVSTALQARGGDECGAVHHLWQRRFYDFNVYSGGKVTEKLNYMHLNPVKRNLVAHLKEWPWSSWSHYADGGGRLDSDRSLG